MGGNVDIVCLVIFDNNMHYFLVNLKLRLVNFIINTLMRGLMNLYKYIRNRIEEESGMIYNGSGNRYSGIHSVQFIEQIVVTVRYI